MFRENVTKYLITSVSLVLVFVVLLALYEVFYKTDDSTVDTIIAIAHGVGPAVAITITLVATWEVIKVVLANRLKERWAREAKEQGRQEANRLWAAWNNRRMEAERNGEPFNETPPDVEVNGTSPSQPGA